MPISPHKLAEGGSEHAEQVALFQAVAISGRKLYPQLALMHAVPNGSVLIGSGTDRGRSEGSKMKAEGLKAGVPDVFLPATVQSKVPLLRGYRWPGLWIEMKKLGREKELDGGLSVEQVKWHRDLWAQGYAVATCYGWISATHALAQYMAGEFVMPDVPGCLMYHGHAKEAF